jgi:uncharacterized protein
MALQFEWDAKKATENLRKHGIDFKEAKTVFNDPFAVTNPDPRFLEERYIDIGISAQGKLLTVVYTERQANIRIISCRRATAVERQAYESL